MPEVCRFFGIIIRMYFDEHVPPHFHAIYGDEQVLIHIENMSIIAGFLSPRALGLVVEWASLHKSELLQEWELAEAKQPLFEIDPLK